MSINKLSLLKYGVTADKLPEDKLSELHTDYEENYIDTSESRSYASIRRMR